MYVRQVRFAQTRTPRGDLAETLSRVYCIDEGEVVYRCSMIELPWRDNEQGETWKEASRIPAGRYKLERLESSPSFDYPHLWVHEHGEVDVEGRVGIKWHIANYARQLRGCGAPGRSFVDLDGDGVVDVTDSEETLNELLDLLPPICNLEVVDNDDPAEMESAPLEEIRTETLVSQVQNLDV